MTTDAPIVRIGRVYDPPGPEDGLRVLIDRLWPRGLRKDSGQFDEWLKQVAPSTELRAWFGHRADRFAEFTHRYQEELADADHEAALAHLLELAQANRTLTLLTASKDVELSHAVVLAAAVRNRLG